MIWRCFLSFAKQPTGQEVNGWVLCSSNIWGSESRGTDLWQLGMIWHRLIRISRRQHNMPDMLLSHVILTSHCPPTLAILSVSKRFVSLLFESVRDQTHGLHEKRWMLYPFVYPDRCWSVLIRAAVNWTYKSSWTSVTIRVTIIICAVSCPSGSHLKPSDHLDRHYYMASCANTYVFTWRCTIFYIPSSPYADLPAYHVTNLATLQYQ